MARTPVTQAIRQLRDAGVEYTEHPFDYERHPGAQGAAEALDVDMHDTIKTIVFVTDDNSGAVVLIHGDLEVSVKKLARVMGVKTARPATQRQADRITGYRFGGTSPLGMRSLAPVFAHETLAQMGRGYVNAGSRGFLIGIETSVLLDLIEARLADLAVD